MVHQKDEKTSKQTKSKSAAVVAEAQAKARAEASSQMASGSSSQGSKLPHLDGSGTMQFPPSATVATAARNRGSEALKHVLASREGQFQDEAESRAFETARGKALKRQQAADKERIAEDKRKKDAENDRKKNASGAGSSKDGILPPPNSDEAPKGAAAPGSAIPVAPKNQVAPPQPQQQVTGNAGNAEKEGDVNMSDVERDNDQEMHDAEAELQENGSQEESEVEAEGIEGQQGAGGQQGLGGQPEINLQQQQQQNNSWNTHGNQWANNNWGNGWYQQGRKRRSSWGDPWFDDSSQEHVNKRPKWDFASIYPDVDANEQADMAQDLKDFFCPLRDRIEPPPHIQIVVNKMSGYVRLRLEPCLAAGIDSCVYENVESLAFAINSMNADLAKSTMNRVCKKSANIFAAKQCGHDQDRFEYLKEAWAEKLQPFANDFAEKHCKRQATSSAVTNSTNYISQELAKSQAKEIAAGRLSLPHVVKLQKETAAKLTSYKNMVQEDLQGDLTLKEHIEWSLLQPTTFQQLFSQVKANSLIDLPVLTISAPQCSLSNDTLVAPPVRLDPKTISSMSDTTMYLQSLEIFLLGVGLLDWPIGDTFHWLFVTKVQGKVVNLRWGPRPWLENEVITQAMKIIVTALQLKARSSTRSLSDIFNDHWNRPEYWSREELRMKIVIDNANSLIAQQQEQMKSASRLHQRLTSGDQGTNDQGRKKHGASTSAGSWDRGGNQNDSWWSQGWDGAWNGNEKGKSKEVKKKEKLSKHLAKMALRENCTFCGKSLSDVQAHPPVWNDKSFKWASFFCKPPEGWTGDLPTKSKGGSNQGTANQGSGGGNDNANAGGASSKAELRTAKDGKMAGPGTLSLRRPKGKGGQPFCTYCGGSLLSCGSKQEAPYRFCTNWDKCLPASTELLPRYKQENGEYAYELNSTFFPKK